MNPALEQSSKNIFPQNKRIRPISASTCQKLQNSRSRIVSSNQRTVVENPTQLNFQTVMEGKESHKAFKAILKN
jgi:hypothetical protein